MQNRAFFSLPTELRFASFDERLAWWLQAERARTAPQDEWTWTPEPTAAGLEDLL